MFHTALSQGKHTAQVKERYIIFSPSEKDRKKFIIRAQVKGTGEIL